MKKEKRLEIGITQEKLAEMIGIGPLQMLNIENKKSYPSLKVMRKLIVILNISPKELAQFYDEER